MASASELIGDARTYADDMLGEANNALGQAVRSIENMGYTVVGFDGVGLPEQPSPPDKPELPAFNDVPLDLPQAPPDTLILQDIPETDVGDAPEFTADAPKFNAPNKPSQLAQFAGSLPSINLSAAFPSAPSLSFPEAPALIERAIPIAPSTVLPAFGGVRPTDVGGGPTDLRTVLAQTYKQAAPEFITMATGYVDAQLLKINPQYHAQMGRIEAQLKAYLDGGTGLKPSVEDAIYARARSKNNAETRRVRDQALTDAASRGFTMPTGALLSATQQARQAGADANAAAAREVVVMQAEMEQKNLQFAVTTSTGLRTAMISATLNYMNNVVALNSQASAYASSVVDALVETYNATVRAYSARLEGYKADATVYQSLLQASLAGIEVYKAEIDALQALTQVDMAKVNVYRARIDVLTAATDMYKTQVEAAVSKASLERLKVDVFQAQVQAYSAQVNAKNAEWQGYTAELGSDEARARIFATEAQAYSAEVDGFRAKVQAKSAGVQAIAVSNDAMSRVRTAALDNYRAVVQAKGQVSSTKLENQRQQVVAFQARTQADVAQYQARSEYYRAAADIGIKNAQLSIESMLKSAELTQSYGKSIADLHGANANIFGSVAGAALSGMNSLASQSATE